jgi:MFS family permease
LLTGDPRELWFDFVSCTKRRFHDRTEGSALEKARSFMAASDRVERTGWLRDPSMLLAAAGMLTMATALGIDRFVYTPILPLMAKATGLSAAHAGLIASANFLGYLVGALAAAKSDLPGSRRVWLVATLSVSALATGTMGLVSSLSEFLVVRFVGGAAGAFAIVVAISLVVERLAVEGRSTLLVVHFGGVGVGIALSGALVSGWLAIDTGWRLLWIAASAISLSFTLMVAGLISQEPASRRAVAVRSNSNVRPGFWALIVANGLSSFGYVITATFLVAIVRQSPELRPLESWIWVLFGVATAPSVAVWTWVGSHAGIARALSLAYLVEAAGVALSVLCTAETGMIIATIFVGATFIANTALGMTAARALCDGDTRRPVALMTAAFGVGQIAGPTFAGVLHDVLGSFLVPSVVAAIGLLVGALLVGRLKAPGL